MAANNIFERVQTIGWRLGLGNMLRKESQAWWGTRRWWTQALVWLVILNGFLAIILFVLPSMAGEVEEGGIPTGVEMLFNMGVTLLSLGTIVLCQGSVVDEKLSGTGEWVLSKPLSRPAFLLAKFIGNGAAILTILVLFQSAAAYLMIRMGSGEWFPILPYLAGVALLGLHVLFYLALTLMVGVFASNRGLVLAVPLGVLLGGGILQTYIGRVALFTPWPIANVLPLLVKGAALPQELYLPFWMTAAWTLVFLVVSLWKFQRSEF